MEITSQQRSGATLFEFALYFLRLGCFGFGGPIALVGHMQKDLVEERGWISQQDYLDGLAFSQLAPGPLAAQLAMYLGHVRAGFPGATVVGIAFIIPSFLMVVAIGQAYRRFGGTHVIADLFYGIGAAVIGIIAQSAIKLVKTSVKKEWLLWGVFLLLALSTAVTEQEIVWLFLAAGVIVMFVRGMAAIPKAPKAVALFVPFAFHLPSQAGTLLAFFLKASLFVFGSGLAIVPFLHGGVVLQHHWLTETQFLDAVAVAMITPGPVVITSAFIGYLVAGFAGACAAALGVFLPVYLFVVLVGPFYKRFSQNVHIRAFVQGVTVAATGAIAGAVLVLAKHSVRDVWTAAIAVATFLTLSRWKIPEPIIIGMAAILGLAIHV